MQSDYFRDESHLIEWYNIRIRRSIVVAIPPTELPNSLPQCALGRLLGFANDEVSGDGCTLHPQEGKTIAVQEMPRDKEESC